MTIEEKKEDQKIVINIEAFEGPLDLLLHLIREQNIDIFDIPIHLITQQYLDYIETQQVKDINIASEYLVMAATLIEIKTKIMLPKPKIEEELVEELEDPRQDLVMQLIQYQKYQEVGHVLDEKQQIRMQEYPKEPADLSQYRHHIPLQENALTTEDLWRALEKMVQRLKYNEIKTATVQSESYTVNDAMLEIEAALRLAMSHQCTLMGILHHSQLTRERVVTLFLAILQLVKQQKIIMTQEKSEGDISLIGREEVV